MWRRGEGNAEPPMEPLPAEQPERHGRRDREGTGMADAEVTVVGQGARLEGTIVSAGSLRIDGAVKGQVNADGDVMLSAQSQVEADIRAENVVIAGRFTGNIFVKGKAELSRGGRIDGNVTSKVLVVQAGGIFCGQSLMDEQAQKVPAAPPPPAASQQAQQGSTQETRPGIARPQSPNGEPADQAQRARTT